MTTTQLTAVAQAKEWITDTILNGAYHGHFIDMCAKENWMIAEMHAKGLNDAAMDEIKAHTEAEIAKYRGTLDKVLSKEAAMACKQFIGSLPFGSIQGEDAIRKFTIQVTERDEPLTLGEFLGALRIIRDRTNAAFDEQHAKNEQHRALKADVAAMRRVLGIEQK